MKKVILLIVTVILATTLSACDMAVDTTDLQGSIQTEQSEESTTIIEETVLIEEAGIKITAKSLSTNGMFGAEVKLLIENNSGKDLTFQCRNASVNGYMVEPLMSIDVVNGKKANDALTFMHTDLERCGIHTISDMEFSFHIFTTTDLETYLDTPLLQLETSAQPTYEYIYDDSGNVAYNENGIKIVIRGLSENSSIFGPEIAVYIENNTDKNITIQAKDVSANGFMVEAMFSADITAGKRAIDSITFLSSELEENGITKFETVDLSFHIIDTESWETIVDTNSVTLIY